MSIESQSAWHRSQRFDVLTDTFYDITMVLLHSSLVVLLSLTYIAFACKFALVFIDYNSVSADSTIVTTTLVFALAIAI